MNKEEMESAVTMICTVLKGLLESPSDLEIRFKDAINELKDMKEEFNIK